MKLLICRYNNKLTELYHIAMKTPRDFQINLTSENEHNVFVVGDGVYMKHHLGGESRWTIILNKYRACGWYDVNSPYVSGGRPEKDFLNEGSTDTKVYGRFGEVYDVRPGLQGKVPRCCKPRHPAYNKENISYIIDSDHDGYETIRFFLHDKGELIAHLDPNCLRKENAFESEEWWNPYEPYANWSTYVMGQFNRSLPISNIPIYSPTCDRDYDVSLYGEQGEEVEYRQDPFNHKLYTKQEFYDYYQRDLEWELQSPDRIIKRKKINDMIFRYRRALPVENINHLLDMMIETFC